MRIRDQRYCKKNYCCATDGNIADDLNYFYPSFPKFQPDTFNMSGNCCVQKKFFVGLNSAGLCRMFGKMEIQPDLRG